MKPSYYVFERQGFLALLCYAAHSLSRCGAGSCRDRGFYSGDEQWRTVFIKMGTLKT